MTRVVYTAGVWDQLHAGHLNILRRSKALGDLLAVGVLTDIGTAAYKPRPPLYNEHARLEIVRSLSFVDAAFLQPGTDPSPVLLALNALGLRPAAMTHGDDWTRLKEGGETLEQLGIELVLLPYTPDVSTTRVRALLDAATDPLGSEEPRRAP
jgi:glycerol-3-phosphate cytidylyltransferase